MLLDLPTATVPVTRVRASETTGRGVSLDPVLQAAAATDAGSTGLPIGVQVIAIDGRDQTAIRVMAAIERGSATQS
jgi:Asp-tRNA(Asn)/Glu-tRNA(Gln) amidotransferase A subunit family amidase